MKTVMRLIAAIANRFNRFFFLENCFFIMSPFFLVPSPCPETFFPSKKYVNKTIFGAAVYKKAFNIPNRQNTPNTGNRENRGNTPNTGNRGNRGNTLNMLDTLDPLNGSNISNTPNTPNPSNPQNMKKAFKYNHHQDILKTKAILDEQG
jgi:hypothetical protein